MGWEVEKLVEEVSSKSMVITPEFFTDGKDCWREFDEVEEKWSRSRVMLVVVECFGGGRLNIGRKEFAEDEEDEE